jgi:hypothetical protein
MIRAIPPAYDDLLEAFESFFGEGERDGGAAR